MLSRLRCGIPDTPPPLQHSHQRLQSRSDTLYAYASWSKRLLTWYFSPRRAAERVSFTARHIKRIQYDIYHAALAWTTAATGLLDIRETSDLRNADIRVSFETIFNESVVLGHASFPWGGRGVVLRSNDYHSWYTSHELRAMNSTAAAKAVRHGVNLFSTLVHEFGHNLGLRHTPYKHCIMHPYMTMKAFS